MPDPIVYSATCSADGRQYIGCTKQTLLRRRHLHAAEAASGKSGKFMEAIRAHGISGFEWKVECIFLVHADALSYEGVFVEDRLTRVSGLNTYRGGFRNGGRARTDAERAELRKAAFLWQSKRADYGAEIRAKLQAFYQTEAGLLQLGTRKATANRPDVRKRMSESHGGRPVEVYRNGELMHVYLTQGECARALGISQGNLNSCLLNRPGCKSLRGFTFGFAKECSPVSSDTNKSAA